MVRCPYVFLLVVSFLASSCQSGCSAQGRENPGAENTELSPTVEPTSPHAALRVNRTHPIWGGSFYNGQSCALCHSNTQDTQAMRAADGSNAAPFDQWKATMMANAARDPFWRAVVSAEKRRTPSQADAIEAKCMRCHAPMASTNSALHGSASPTLGLLQQSSIEAQLALDGVSCALCHQVQPDNLGSEASFTGHFVIKPERKIFGPYPDPFAQPMQNNMNFDPVQGVHIQTSGLCGSCHTLFTNALTPEGTPTGHVFPEQTPYLEWRNSVFNNELPSPAFQAQSCQGCHMPMLMGDNGDPWATRIARSPHGEEFGRAPARSPYRQHLFVGGNTVIPAILRDNMDVFQPVATRSAFDAVIALAKSQLQTRTAKLSFVRTQVEGGALSVAVRLENLTGHRFPTGYPGRRAWVRLTVRDANGSLLFTSGAFDDRGRLLDADAKILPEEIAGGGAYPHLALIENQSQVHVLDLVMGDANGQITYALMRAATPLRDNRLLPLGWKADHPDAPHTKPYGTDTDPDFLPGQDTIAYKIPLTPAQKGPLAVEATLFYQVIGARYVDELFAVDTPEVAAFKQLYDALPAADLAPVAVASQTATIHAP